MKNLLFSMLILGTAYEASAVSEGAGIRSKKTAYAAYEAIGLTLMPINGGRVGYFINQDLVAEVGAGSGGATIGSFSVDKTLVEAKMKYFFGNSFYVDGGLAFESWNVNYTTAKAGSASFETVDLSGKVSNTGLVFHIGNQWQWSGFTLGCDWAGYFAGLSTSSSFDSSDLADAGQKEDEEKSALATLGGGSVHLARAYLGWAF